jgi:ABC-type polysaccharide/polyol phosphate export permease
MAASPRQSLAASLAVQGRVIHALLLRELITRFGRRNVGVLWLIVEPMLFTTVIMAFWALSGMRRTSNVPVAAFAITGYSSVLMWRNTVSHCLHAIESNSNLLYHRNVQLLDVFVARILLEVGGATGSFIVMTVGFAAAGVIQLPDDPLKVIFGWLMLGWFGGALALLVGAATAFGDIVARLWSPLSYILFPLSGAAFMVAWLPPATREAVLALPMVHCVELLREGFFGASVHTFHNMGYVAVCNLLLTFFGLALLRYVASRVEAR